ncbi:hypothetical protein B0A55_05180 [Friedmanniomyces simplex]|uniref:YTH domain-containing protein n=1 Tax=Friedmanniomyces simplex TaxID=329884 RepID=A0A4U0XI48_9PEZI|nr:hypothetical protein B0A55_05180 [Friedmanniomyces simplex]
MGEAFDPERATGRFNSGNDTEHQPFHSQFDYVMHPQQTGLCGPVQYGAPFDMSAMGKALPPRPQYGEGQNVQRHQYGESPNVLSPASVYQMQHAAQYAGQRGQPPFPQQYHPGHTQMPVMQRGPSMGVLPPPYHSPVDMYGYALSVPQHSPIGTRFSPPAFPMGGAVGPAFGQFDRRSSEHAPVPAFPRGPPRKPRQSGHALWVGNLPPATTVTDLKDYFSRDATKEIDSIFLISKSNCAFVNYRSEPACTAAMSRFHDARFNGVRLVCRLRRGSTTSREAGTIADTVAASPSLNSGADLPDGLPDGVSNVASRHDEESPVIVGQGRSSSPPTLPEGVRTSSPVEGGEKVPEKYFIIKSLTVQDLEASVRNGIWATQSHNEQALNRAYDEADNVYLVFSANKSGEYFGYARMASIIAGEPVNLGASANTETEDVHASGTPQSINTPATETAPKGRIIDDSARGSIFWEAEHSDDESESPTKEAAATGSGAQWGRQFKIEWQSTARLPFFRTRGLRNPWNANREVKIARDGTELEPGVGRRLVTMFHGPTPSPGVMPMQYR